MGLIVKHADGSEFLNIANKTYDDVSTSLKLPGKGVLNWGEAYVNNFVHLLENFASSIEPQNPQVGQIWYNTGSGVLSVYTIGQEWEIINKDTDIEAKFDALVTELQESNAGTIPPTDVSIGTTWFDTNVNVLKVFNGTEWVSFGFNSIASFIQPSDSEASDLWYDKNINNLKVYDGSQFQRLISTIESTNQPTNSPVGQFWTNTTTGQIFIYKQEPSTGEYYWQELGAEIVTEGDILPTIAKTGALHITRTTFSNILYINKGTKTSPVWVEIPEFGGAIKSVNEPVDAKDGMFWLDGNDVLKIRKSGVWTDIDQTAISYISETMPTDAKDGMVWFDTSTGSMKIKVGSNWEAVQDTGLIEYGVAPISPKEGQLWFDNTRSELKIFNGTSWTVVNNSSTIVSYQTPLDATAGQLWLDTTSSELKVMKDGRWASLPENARAHLTIPASPKNGDMAYVNNALKIYDGSDWKDININIDNSTTGDDVSINYDEISHEIVIVSDGITTRVPLAVSRDVIVENVGITSDVVEVIHPDISEGERRIIDIQKVNLNRSFFVFRNGRFTDDYYTDSQDLILNSAAGDDEIDILQFNGDISINYLVKKFKSTINGNFTIDNYTRTLEEQEEYDIVKAEYDAKLVELIAQYGDNSSESDLTDADWAILDEIESRFPIKTSNQIADLSLGSIIVFKEGIFIPTDDLTINESNENKIIIPNTNAGEIYTIIQLIAGNDYKSSFFSRENSFTIGAVEDTTESTLNVAGKMMTDMLQAASKNTAGYGEVDVDYIFNDTEKTVTFSLMDIDADYHFFVTRNNLFVSPVNYTVNTTNNTLTMHANSLDEIRFFQFYLPHNYVPIEFNYKEALAANEGWITIELNQDFDLNSPLLVYRNGMLQESANINIITQETLVDDNGITYTVDGLRKVQIFGDAETNDESISGVQIGDIVTVMQVSQPEFYNIYLEEFGATVDGFNIFTFNEIDSQKDILVYRNGMKLDDTNFYINDDGKLVVSDCNGPTIDELAINPNAKGDIIIVYQFFTKDVIAEDDLTYTKEIITATTDGYEYFQLQNTEFVADEFLLVFKNGQLITRKQPESEDTNQTQINTYKVFAERVYNNTVPALDINGDPIYDSEGNPVLNVDPEDYTDIMAFSLDNVVAGEEIVIYEFNKKVTNVNNLSSENHYEILPKNNIQRIYTSKFDQLSNLTMVFQDGLIIDRKVDSNGNDNVRIDGMFRILDQYAVDNITKSIIVNDWKVGGKLRIQQFTAQSTDIKTITLSVTILADGTYDVFLPNNETYTPNAGAIEVYVDRQIQWTGEDYQEVANNRIMFTRQLMKDQVVKMIIRK